MTDLLPEFEIAHAVMSASGSAKWMGCPGSIQAELMCGVADVISAYAREGTLAHKVADMCLSDGKDASVYLNQRVLGQLVSPEMVLFVQEYIDYVRSHFTKNSCNMTEDRVRYDNVTQGGFGTLDAAVLDFDTGICHIFDLKYGKGVKVSAKGNTQAQLYAIGLYNELSFLEVITSFRIHIIQPRIPNNTWWDITVQDLMEFQAYAKERARLTTLKNAPRIPGTKQCRWCRAKVDCPEYKAFAERTIADEFDIITIDETQ